MDLADIRRLAITALFSDDALLDQLVLKGGNAVNLVYGFGTRGSVDIDFSLEHDFGDLEDARNKILGALRARFSGAGYSVFDESFQSKPSASVDTQENRWGGYEVLFKLIESRALDKIGSDLDHARREALVIGPGQQRVFRIQVSKYEYCAHKKQADLDDYTIYVYSPEMLVVEKLRAICQQMPEYPARVHPTPRARDFYDIHSVMTGAQIDLSTFECQDLAVLIFAAKDVPMKLMGKIAETREFHRPDWPSVQLSVAGELQTFDFYFDFVVEQGYALKPLWGE